MVGREGMGSGKFWLGMALIFPYRTQIMSMSGVEEELAECGVKVP